MDERQDESVVDRAHRMAALDPTSSFIVQAPAGSGKTELLIQRFLTLLATVEHPESIVAVTFTRKAAGEMRHRVEVAMLHRMRNSDAISEKEHERHTWELCRRALARDKERDWRLIAASIEASNSDYRFALRHARAANAMAFTDGIRGAAGRKRELSLSRSRAADHRTAPERRCPGRCD